MFDIGRIKSLNELEIVVYNYVIKQQSDVLKMTIRELAEEAHVSTTTILRFCKKMDCEGYSEFKLKYKMELAKKHRLYENNDIHSMIDFFQKLDNEEFNQQLSLAAQMIYEQDKIIFLGIGTSGILGKYGARFFTNIGKLALAIDDPFYPVPNGHYDNASIIVLSVSGETQQMIEMMNHFKAKNSSVISITNSRCNTIARLSDLALTYYMPMDILDNAVNITTQVPVIYMIEAITKKVHKLINEETC